MCRHRCRDKTACAHQCCKGPTTSNDNIDKTERKRQSEQQSDEQQSEFQYPGEEVAERAAAAKDPREALRLLRIGIDRYVNYRCNKYLFQLGSYIELPDHEREELINSDSASDCYFVGRASFSGIYGFPQQIDLAWQKFCRGAEQGHAYCIYWKGRCLKKGWGAPADPVQSVRCFIESADLGCVSACYAVGIRYRNGTAPLHRNFHLAAVYFLKALRGGDHERSKLLRDRMFKKYRLQIAPWGRWIPTTGLEQQLLIPSEVTAAERTWLLIKRKRLPFLPRDIAWLVSSYIHTQNGWTQENPLQDNQDAE